MWQGFVCSSNALYPRLSPEIVKLQVLPVAFSLKLEINVYYLQLLLYSVLSLVVYYSHLLGWNALNFF